MKHVFVINSTSGSKSKRRKLFDHIIDVCKAENLDYDIHFTQGPGDAYRFARELAETGIDVRFYGCGGDGTANELASAVAHLPNAQFTVVPIGSGNDFIRCFGTIEDFMDITSLIYGDPMTIDIIKVNDTNCVNITNIGFDRRVVSAQNEIKKSRIFTGSIAYILGVIVTLFKHEREVLHFRFEDGSEATMRLLLCLFANGQYYGGGFHACPEADLTDGLFNTMIVPPIGRLKFISLVGKFKKGHMMDTEFGKKEVIYKKCKTITISRSTPISYCIDGEILEADKIELTIDPLASVFVRPAARNS